MLQRKIIPLTGKDRPNGERFPLAASGGVFFDQVDGIGIMVRFDEDPTLVPIRNGRSIDRSFRELWIEHGAGYTGNIVAYTYEKGEGIFDSPSTAEIAALEGVVIGYADMSTVTGGRYAYWQLANPVGSGVLIKLMGVTTISTQQHDLRRFTTDLPLEAVGTIVLNQKYQDFRQWAATPSGVLTCGQNPLGGDVPLTHEGGIAPFLSVTPSTANRAICDASFAENGGFILPPGEFLVCAPRAAAMAVMANVITWRELAQV
jgi:hypothetical protein